MSWTRRAAKGKRAQLEALSASMTDEAAAAIPMIAPQWRDLIGVEVDEGFRFAFGDELYTVIKHGEGQKHTFQEYWPPDQSPSLYARVLPGQSGEIGPWKQPGSTNGYSKGDRVTHNGKTWESDCDNNVWEPGVAMWHEVAA